jgi:hypothetical protein
MQLRRTFEMSPYNSTLKVHLSVEKEEISLQKLFIDNFTPLWFWVSLNFAWDLFVLSFCAPRLVRGLNKYGIHKYYQKYVG